MENIRWEASCTAWDDGDRVWEITVNRGTADVWPEETDDADGTAFVPSVLFAQAETKGSNGGPAHLTIKALGARPGKKRISHERAWDWASFSDPVLSGWDEDREPPDWVVRELRAVLATLGQPWWPEA